MKYPIAIKKPASSSEAWSVVVPDLDGCFSAADSGVDEAIVNAKEAIELWIETAMESGTRIPESSPLAQLQKDNQFNGWILGVVEIDLASIKTKFAADCRAQSLMLANEPGEHPIAGASDTDGWK